jgi:hypothetical protein
VEVERRQATHGEKVKDSASPAKLKMKKKGWVKPMQDYLKLNVDVSFDADDL